MPMAIRTEGDKIAPISCTTCKWKGDCGFDQKSRGGFKGAGPKYVGYVLITDKAENNVAKRDTISCFNFIRSGLQDRMVNGAARLVAGIDADRIRIVAQEGDTIERVINLSVNSLGEIVRPQREIIEDLKASGYKIAPDHSPSIGSQEITFKSTVPCYADERRKAKTFRDSIIQGEEQHAQSLADAEDAVFDLVYQEARARNARPEVMASDDDSVLDMDDGPKSEPMRRRGRPPREMPQQGENAGPQGAP